MKIPSFEDQSQNTDSGPHYLIGLVYETRLFVLCFRREYIIDSPRIAEFLQGLLLQRNRLLVA
jgi:hypothetical protein